MHTLQESRESREAMATCDDRVRILLLCMFFLKTYIDLFPGVPVIMIYITQPVKISFLTLGQHKIRSWFMSGPRGLRITMG